MTENVELEYWIYGKPANGFGFVEVPIEKDVSFLSKTICKKSRGILGYMHPNDLELYSVTYTANDDLQRVLWEWTPVGKSKLIETSKLSTLFSDSTKGLIIVRQPNTADVPLKFWVYGEPTSKVLSVNILSSKTIENLQVAIKNENPIYFWDVNADDLMLFSASLTQGQDNSLHAFLNTLTIANLGHCLESQQQLVDVFPPLSPDDRLHFIVVPKEKVPFQCWIRGEDPEYSFKLWILMTATVNNFRQHAAQIVVSGPKDIVPSRIKLYKISANDDANLSEILDSVGSGELLKGDDLLGNIFNDVPLSRIPRVVFEILDEGGPKPHEDPIATARAKFLKANLREAPSTIAHLDMSQKRQRDPAIYIRCGHPREYEATIPPTLLHPVFEQFRDDCQTSEVTAVDNEFIQGLMLAMSQLHETERERIAAVNDVFLDWEVEFTDSTTPSNYHIDADLKTCGHHYVIIEYKNELTSGTSESYFQAIAYYEDVTRKAALKYIRSPLPCFLLVIAGPIIMFAGAAWNNRPTIQPLSIVMCHTHFTDTDAELNLARHMIAFRKATRTLKEYYEDLNKQTVCISPPDLPHIFPYPRSYTRLDGSPEEINFQYREDVDPSKLIFFGEEDTGDHICIKFVRAYSCEAHKHLAHLGYAPRLRGFQALPGLWFMVVMDMLSDGFETLRADYGRYPYPVLEKISSAVTSLHDAGYVHGDIRGANIMVSKTDRPDEQEVKIIDFDWSGRIGEARYPAHVNFEDMRPEGARDGELILKEHDLDMLERIRGMSP